MHFIAKELSIFRVNFLQLFWQEIFSIEIIVPGKQSLQQRIGDLLSQRVIVQEGLSKVVNLVVHAAHLVRVRQNEEVGLCLPHLSGVADDGVVRVGVEAGLVLSVHPGTGR